MSEVSETLHVRSGDAEACIIRLREGGFQGFVFRGTRGWLTLVPFGGPEGLFAWRSRLSQLSATLDAPVMLHGCNDFGWEFQLHLPDGRRTALLAMTGEMAEIAAAMTPEMRAMADELGEQAGLEAAALDETVLAEVVPPSDVRPFLATMLDASVDPCSHAHAFAEVLGLPQHEWLSPAYVTDEPDEARRRGGEVIGVIPPGTEGF